MSVAEALSLMIQFGSLSLVAFIVTIIFFLNQKNNRYNFGRRLAVIPFMLCHR